MNIETQLDDLANLQAQAEVIRLEYEQRRKAIMTPEIQAQLDALDAEQATALEPVQAQIERTTEAVKSNILSIGESVKGTWLHAIYTKPRVTWDGKGLDGFAIAHPEINAFRKVGEASVSIRSVK